jgi:hypothetical protein
VRGGLSLSSKNAAPATFEFRDTPDTYFNAQSAQNLISPIDENSADRKRPDQRDSDLFN